MINTTHLIAIYEDGALLAAVPLGGDIITAALKFLDDSGYEEPYEYYTYQVALSVTRIPAEEIPEGWFLVYPGESVEKGNLPGNNNYAYGIRI